MYASYVQNSRDPASEPFLIPELRYAGFAHEHLYRVDYSIFNAHTMQFVGFELSPHSTHMAVKGMATQTQAAVNAKLASQWEKEMDKRNSYFEQFDLPIITFTDSQLTDLPGCFSVMAGYLSARPEEPVKVADQVHAIESF
ncbi:MAG: hypothetical protein LC667_14205 [Thioalkalivibrio sp.]|nr:hypothetical protein [Thioalkalivibrio sp.]